MRNFSIIYAYICCQQTDVVFEAGKAAKLLMNEYTFIRPTVHCACIVQQTELGLQIMLCECKRYIA